MYFMRGALSMDEMYDLTEYEKEIIQEFIEERIEIEMSKKSGNHVY